MFTNNGYSQLLMLCCHCLHCVSPFHKNLRSQWLVPSPYLPASSRVPEPLHNLSCADQAVSIYIKLRGKQKTIKLFFSFYKVLAVSVSANRFKSLYKLYTVTRGFMEIEIRGRTFWFNPIPRKQNKMWLVCCSLVGAAQLAVHQQVCLFNDEVSDLAEWTGEMGTRGSGDFCILRLIQDFKLKWN